MPSGTAQDAQAASQKLAGDPQFQQILQRIAGLVQQQQSVKGTPQSWDIQNQIFFAENDAEKYAKSVGALPHDWSYNFKENTLNKDSFWDRNPWVAPALAIAGAVAAPIAFSALATGGGAAVPGATASGASSAAPAGLGATATAAPAGEAAIADAAVPGLEAGAIPGGVDAATMSGVGSALPAGGTGLGTAANVGGGILDSAGKILNSKAGKVVSKVAPILGNMAKAGAEANASRDRLLPSMQAAKLAQQKFALDAPSTRMTQSMRASGIKSASPTHVNWGGPGSGLRGEVPSFTGGFSGALSNIDPETKALADEVLHKDLRDQLAGRDSETPYLDQFGKESTMDKIVGGASTGASIWDAVKGIWKPKPTIMT